MNLQGRDLSNNVHGDDVKLLHSELRQLGFEIVDNELQESHFGPSTRKIVQAFQQSTGLPITGVVDEPTAQAINAAVDALPPPLIVRGQVTYPNGGSAPEILITAFDKDLRNETELGRTLLSPDGSYEITYSADQFRRAEKGSADLIVRAIRVPDNQLLAASPIRFNSRPVETVDLVVDGLAGQPSEIERYVDVLKDVLEDVRLDELSAQEIDFLASETGIVRAHIAALVTAAGLEADSTGEHSTDIDLGSSALRIAAAAFYGWLRQGLPSQPGRLWEHTTADLLAALKLSLAQNLIPAALGEQLDAIAAAIDAIRIADQLRPAADGVPASLGDLLTTLPEPLDHQQQLAVAAVVKDLGPGAPDLVTRLEAAGLQPADAVRVERTLRLDNLTLGHTSLIRSLQEQVTTDHDASLRSLADLPGDRWLDLAYAHGTPGPEGLAVPEYAAQLEQQVEALHPNATLAAKLGAGRLVIARPGFGELETFLQNNPSFDLLGTTIETATEEAHFDGIEHKQDLLAAIQQLQRVKALSATWQESAVLLNRGVTSALEVVELGRSRLEDLLEGRIPAERLDAIYEAATLTHDMTLNMIVATLPQFSNLSPGMGLLADAAPDVDLNTVPLSPTLRGLFGDLDMCECEHCGSVLSPAAYFVDLLEFIKPDPAALNALLGHRPDLLDLELSCGNTETELPHIDLVMEILENAVGLPHFVDLPAGSDTAALLTSAANETETTGTAQLPKVLVDALKETALDLPDRLAVAARGQLLILNGPSLWTVSDRRRRWGLLHRENGFFATRRGLPAMHRLPLAPADTAAMITALDTGSVLASARLQFEAFLQSLYPDSPSPGLRTVTYRISPLQPGSRWKITCSFATWVMLAQAVTEPVGILTITNDAGDTLFRDTYSARSIDATQEALNRGDIGGLLPAVIAASTSNTVTADAHRGGWIITTPEQELELDFLPENLSIAALAYQSSSPEVNLLAAPENRNPAAYRVLRAAEFPWSLPFDLPLTEVRAFLDKLRLPRWQLMELLTPPAARLSSNAISREMFGLSAAAAELIGKPDTSDALWWRWGLNVHNGSVTIHDAATDAGLTGSPLQILARVSIVLQQARLEFGELQDVLQTQFVRAGSPQSLPMEPAAECAPGKLTLRGLTPEHLDRIHRFVRLFRAVAWPAHDLDLALAAVRPGARDGAEVLRRLSHVKQLQETLGLSVAVIASWWGGLGTPVYTAHTQAGQPEIRPLYDRLFLDPLVSNPLDPAFSLRSDRSELAQPGSTFSARSGLICAALSAHQDDLQALITAAVPDSLTLANLSALHRILSLCRALGLSAADYLSARRLTGIDPFADTDRALEFCNAVGSIHAAGVPIEELAYILRHEVTPGYAFALSDERAAIILAELRAELQAARQATLVARSTLAERLLTHLSRAGWLVMDIESLLRDITGWAAVELPDEPELLGRLRIPDKLLGIVRVSGRTLETLDVLPGTAFDPTSLESLYQAVPAATNGYADYSLALGRLKAILKQSTAAAVLAMQRPIGLPGEPFPPQPMFRATEADQLLVPQNHADARQLAILERLLDREQRKRTIVTIARVFMLDEATAASLLLERLHHPDDMGKPAVATLLDTGFVNSDARTRPDQVIFASAFTLMHRLHKVALLCQRLGLTPAMVGWLSAFTALNLDDLPVAPLAADAASLFDAWRRLLTLTRLPRRLPGAGPLIDAYAAALLVGNAAALVAARETLAVGLELAPATVEAAAQLLNRAQLGLIPPADPRDPRQLEQLLELLLAVRQTGASPAQLATLAAPAPDAVAGEAAALLARQLLLSKYGPDQWHDLLRPISDALRERQRNALVDYLLVRDGKRDANDLYESYLIDVQMAPCMMTTRILQATSAVQLFVQRCLLNLEPYVPPAAIKREQWEWMKNYRVWEANRKVFLYPENWLLPELRDDKTQAFQELEGNLSQEEASYERAQNALVGYLDDLGELAQVTVVGLYEDKRPDGGQQERVLFAVGRSPNQPYRYFSRVCDRFGEDGMQWGGWERIELDIPGDHVLPFVFEGDLHIAWPVFRKKSDEGKAGFEVQLAWVRRTARGWTKRKVSRDVLTIGVIPNRDERTMFAFRIVKPDSPIETVDIRCFITRRAASLDHKAVADVVKKTVDGDKKAIPTVSLTFFSYVEYSNPTALEPLWNGVSYEGCGMMESGDALVQTKNQEWYALPNLSLYRGGTYKLAGWPEGGVDLKFRASVTTATVDESVVEFPLNLELPSSYTCAHSFIFKGKTQPLALTDNEFPLPMDLAGQFRLSSGDDVEFSMLGGGPVLDQPQKTYSFMSGFREIRSDGASHGVNLDGSLFGASNSGESFFLLPAGPWKDAAIYWENRLWYFEEARRRYYLDVYGSRDTHTLTIYPDAYADSSKYRRLVARGLPALFDPGDPGPQVTNFGADQLATYLSGSQYGLQNDPRASQDIGFALRMPYAIYHWEVFVHAPLRIADELARQQRFEDALRWLHFVFDPTTDEPADPLNPTGRYWKALPLRRAARPARVADVLAWLANTNKDHPEEAELNNQIAVWRRSPFRPHAVARLRHGAYQWRVLFSYIDTLIAWGDQLFQRDTREAIGEATQLYVLAARILGPRPRVTPRRLQAPALSYRALASRGLDKLANAWYVFADTPRVKAAVSESKSTKTGRAGTNGSRSTNDSWSSSAGKGKEILSGRSSTQTLKSLGLLYFCVPQNERLSTYWDTLENRLLKIRYCQNYDGVARDLALWEPPIDPEILVRATAAGVDIASVLADRTAPLPAYRFNLLAQKASELCAELKALGAALLSALEKQDAEELALLRSGHEVELLKLVSQIRQQQVDEAEAMLEALRRTRRMAAERYVQHQRLLGKTEIVIPAEGAEAPQETLSLRPAPGAGGEMAGLGMTQREVDQLFRLNEVQGLSLAAGISNVLGGVMFVASSVASYQDPLGNMKDMFGAIGHGANSVASGLNALASFSGSWAAKDAILASYERRHEDWAFQSNQTARELAQIDKQIAGAALRLATVQLELANHERQIEQSESVDDFMRWKYTNDQLYSWMVSQVSGIYFRTYQLAHDVAKRVERAFQYELGVENSNYIRFGYWNGLKRGLMAGDHLFYDLKRLEVAYLEQNRREYELTRHVSLLQVDPLALIQLRTTGQCTVRLPEALFDMDGPGHYFRRIKTVAVSIPCVTGPYASVNCTLTLQRSTIRKTPTLLNGVYTRQETEDKRFNDYFGSLQSIVTSSGQNDSGLFETNLRDERFLPFEGSGVVDSEWRLQLPANPNEGDLTQFDYNTISDVILHLRYTALDGGSALRQGAVNYVRDMIKVAKAVGCVRLFSVRYEFPTEWAYFQGQMPAANQRYELALTLRPEHFPIWRKKGTGAVTGVEILARSTHENVPECLDVFNQADVQSTTPAKCDELGKAQYGDLLVGKLKDIPMPATPEGELKLYFDDRAVSDLWIAVTWSG